MRPLQRLRTGNLGNISRFWASNGQDFLHLIDGTNMQTVRSVGLVDANEDEVGLRSLIWHPDESRSVVVTGDFLRLISFVNLDTMLTEKRFVGANGKIVAFYDDPTRHPSDRPLLLTGRNGLTGYECESGAKIFDAERRRSRLGSIVSFNGLVYAGEVQRRPEIRVYVYDFQSPNPEKPKACLGGHRVGLLTGMCSMAVDRHRQILFSGSNEYDNAPVLLWDVRTNNCIHVLHCNSPVHSLHFNSSSFELFVSAKDAFRLYDIRMGEVSRLQNPGNWGGYDAQNLGRNCYVMAYCEGVIVCDLVQQTFQRLKTSPSEFQFVRGVLAERLSGTKVTSSGPMANIDLVEEEEEEGDDDATAVAIVTGPGASSSFVSTYLADNSFSESSSLESSFVSIHSLDDTEPFLPVADCSPIKLRVSSNDAPTLSSLRAVMKRQSRASNPCLAYDSVSTAPCGHSSETVGIEKLMKSLLRYSQGDLPKCREFESMIVRMNEIVEEMKKVEDETLLEMSS